MDAFVARQPIFDRDCNVFGYELLFRSGTTNAFNGTDGDAASTTVISDSLHVHGMETLTAGKKGFINITRGLLLNDMITVLPSNLTVVELLESIAPDEEVIKACRSLRKAGYLVAMDDFVFDPAYQPLLHEVDFIKVDFMGTTPEQRANFSATFQRNGTALLAEKIETRTEFEEAQRLGYSLFQGYFFCKPQIIQGKDVPTSQLGCLRLLQQLNAPELDYDRLEQVIKSEVSLSYKLLKYLNSASCGVRTKVTSIKHAMVLLGVRPLRKWASLMALAGLRCDKPLELVVTCLIRARFAEILGGKAGLADRELDLFLAGMLSTIDALTDQPMDRMLDTMRIGDDIKRTLLGQQTPLTPIHSLTLAYERGRWEDVNRLTQELKLTGEIVSQAYHNTLAWADEVSRQV